jgi:hypothetical protein
MFITNVAPLTATGVFPGEHDKPINNNTPGSFGSICGIPVFEAPDVTEQLEEGDTNPMQTLSIIGGYSLSLSNLNNSSYAIDNMDQQKLYKQSRTMKLLNETAGCDYPITLVDMCAKTLWECVFPATDAAGVEDAAKINAINNIFNGTKGAAGVVITELPTIKYNSNADQVRAALDKALKPTGISAEEKAALLAVNKLSFILFRPCQKYITEKMIICRDGKSFGATYVGPSKFEWSIQGNIGTKHGLFTIWIQAIILDVSGVYVLENVMYRACLGGSDTDFVDDKNVNKLKQFGYDYLEVIEDDPEFDKKSIFCFPIPAKTEFYEVPRLVDMTGTIKLSNSRGAPVKGKPGYYPGSEVVYAYLDAGTIKQKPAGLNYVDTRSVLFNTICPREGSKHCSDPERRVFDDVIPNSNHHGPNTDPDCVKVRRGMATGVQYTNVRNFN